MDTSQTSQGDDAPHIAPKTSEQASNDGVAPDVGPGDFTWTGDVGSREEITAARSAVTSLMAGLFKAREIPSPAKRTGADPSRSAEQAAADYRAFFSPDAPDYMKYRIDEQAKATANAWTDKRVGGFTNSAFVVEAWHGTRVEADGRIVVLLDAHYVVDLNPFRYGTSEGGFVEAPGRNGIAIQSCTYRIVIGSVHETPTIQRLDVRNCDGG